MRAPPSCQLSRRRKCRAFSLVEVSIALGILSFSITSLLALMPIGLNVLSNSQEANARAAIVRKLAAELRDAPFHDITSQESMRFFDDEGAEVDQPRDGFLGVTTQVNLSCTLPGAATQLNNLKMVQVNFFNRADRANSASAPTSSTIIFVPHSGI